MNIGLVTGFIVGGLLLVSLLVLSARVSENSGLMALQQMSKEVASAVAETVSTDVRRLGQGIGGAPISHASQNRLVFQSRLDGTNPVTVEWFFDENEEVPGTPNPRDRMLYRIAGDDTTRIGLGVTQFDFTYFDTNGDTTAVLDNIRRIRIELMVESQVALGNEFGRSFWETDITPRAIQ